MIRKNTILRAALLSCIVLAAFSLTDCFAGHVGSEGDALKKYLAPEALKGLAEHPDDSIWIIDVRPTSAYTKGHIPTARLFPSSEIMSRLGELPKAMYPILSVLRDRGTRPGGDEKPGKTRPCEAYELGGDFTMAV